MNTKEIKEILAVLKGTDVSELEIERGNGVRLRIRRGPQGETSVAASPVVMQMPAPRTELPTGPAPTAPAAAAEKPGKAITSPFVGTFYRAPSPDSPNYVEVGTAVKKGQVLCIIEAMKLMNEIEAESDGRVAEILAENGQPVEYGQPLFRIESA